MPGLILASGLFFFARQAAATIDVTLQMQLGNPSNATADTNNHDHYLIQRSVEAIDYSDNLREPNWASWDLTASDVGNSGRSADFYTDTNLPAGFYPVLPTDCSGSGYDRGHMCPSDDRTDNTNDNDMVFFMSNVIPQAPDNNEGVWNTFEGYCRSLATNGYELLITCGPSGFDGSRTASHGSIAIPQYTWKIAVVVPVVPGGTNTALSRVTAATRVIAIKVPNSNGVASTWQTYVTSASQIEVDTGYTFFTALSPTIASALRSEVDGQTNAPPGITGFSPASGAVDSSVVITGTNFGSASAVTFNGVAAVYNVDTATQITATVPTNATSGAISVTTPSGTAISTNSFTVTGLNIDLAINAAHANNFTQGDVGDTYTVTVSNVGSSPSSGTVTVTDVLSSGLTATAISGSGWTTDLGTLTCTRSDALGAGLSYPPITITVNVATNAPAAVTNMATVSGGGDTNIANDVATDSTAVLPATSGADIVVLAGWDVSGQTNFGMSPLLPATNAPNLTVTGLTRGSGVATTGVGANRAFGGDDFVGTSSAAAISAGEYLTFGITATGSYQVSYTSISTFNYRHSATGPTNGLLQYEIGTGSFNDIATVTYPTNTSTGGMLNPINLAGIADLQNVSPGASVTFRIVNWGSTNAGGTWYIFDVASSSAPDFAVSGTFSALTPIESWRLQWFGTTANSGAAADTAIATSDGMPNLLKYALGLNPLVATNSPVVGDVSTGFLRLTTPKNPSATDVSYYVEVTGNLGSAWTTSGTTVDQNTPTLLQVHDNTAVGSVGEQFIRLRVSRP